MANKDKPLKRWSPEWPELKTPAGTLTGCIKDEIIIARLGTICYLWTHVEEQMIGFFNDLIGTENSMETARQIFRAIINQKTRIDVMRTLLTHGRHNKNKDQNYDHILDEFDKTNRMRNNYIHGLWWSHEDGHTYLQSPSVDEMGERQARRVTVKELDNYIKRLMKFQLMIQF